jgi:hypothetical protein
MNSKLFTTVHCSEDWATRVSVLGALAGSANTPADVLQEVYAEVKRCCPISDLLEKLALNPSSDISLLQALAEDASPIVRATVAKNPKAISLMWRLEQDPSAYVRYQLAAVDHFPEHLYESLASDPESRVAARAKRTLRAIQYSQSVVGKIANVVGGFWNHRQAS